MERIGELLEMDEWAVMGLAVATGLMGLVECQRIVSRHVPGALDGSRETITAYAYGLTEEIHEVVREIGWKPWKTPSIPDKARVIEEYADVLAFLGILTVNLAEACAVSPEEFVAQACAQYARTSQRNVARFEHGQEGANVV